MGYAIIKVDRDPADDRWLIWSSIVEAPILTGTRDEVTEYFVEQFGARVKDEMPRRFSRAIDMGTDSAMARGTWNNNALLTSIGPQDGMAWLPRRNLGEYWERYERWSTSPEGTPEPDVSDLLLPL